MSVISVLKKVQHELLKASSCIPVVRDIVGIFYGLVLGFREAFKNPTYDRKQFIDDTKPYFKDSLED